MKKYIDIYNGIEAIRKAENSMPPEVDKYNSRITKEMFADIEKAHGKEIRDAFYQAT